MDVLLRKKASIDNLDYHIVCFLFPTSAVQTWSVDRLRHIRFLAGCVPVLGLGRGRNTAVDT